MTPIDKLRKAKRDKSPPKGIFIKIQIGVSFCQDRRIKSTFHTKLFPIFTIHWWKGAVATLKQRQIQIKELKIPGESRMETLVRDLRPNEARRKRADATDWDKK